MTFRTIPLACLALIVLPLQGAEQNDGELGSVSAGSINLSLEVTHEVAAGFVRTNLDDPESDFQYLMSYRLVENLQYGGSMTIPFCIISTEGGSYSIDTEELNPRNNMLVSEFGSVIPIEIDIGDLDRGGARFKAVDDHCAEGETIPITIRPTNSLDDRDIGRLNGKFNLLIKSE